MKRWLGPVKHSFVSNKDPAKTARTIYYPDWTSSITEHELGRFIDTGTRAETTQPVATDKLSWVTASAAAEWLKGIPCESLKRVCPFPRHVISCPLHIWRSRFVSSVRPSSTHGLSCYCRPCRVRDIHRPHTSLVFACQKWFEFINIYLIYCRIF